MEALQKHLAGGPQGTDSWSSICGIGREIDRGIIRKKKMEVDSLGMGLAVCNKNST